MAAAAAILLQTLACAEDGPSSPSANSARPETGGDAATSQDGSPMETPGPAGAGEWVGVHPTDAGRTDEPVVVDTGVPVFTSDAGSEVPATFETLRFVISQSPCLGAGCHNDDQNPLDLRMDDELYVRLTSHVSMHCDNLPIVSPGDPQRSALLTMLRGPCGPTPRMPLGCVEDGDGTCVPAEYVSAIEQWIAAGAPEG